jgi:hypothetical protein
MAENGPMTAVAAKAIITATAIVTTIATDWHS